MITIATRLATLAWNSPRIMLHSAYSAFDAWPHAKQLPRSWRALPVFCITTKGAIRRHRVLGKQIKRLGFDSFEYVFGPEIGIDDLADLEAQGIYDSAEALKYHKRPLRPAEISCSLAHGLAYEKIASQGVERALIIEDDALFIGRRFELIDLDNLPGRFDVVMINSERLPRQPTDGAGTHLYGSASYVASACAYLVSKNGAETLKRVYKPVIHAADGLLGRCMVHHGSEKHPFKGEGARGAIETFLVAPDLVLNGSCDYYYNSLIRR